MKKQTILLFSVVATMTVSAQEVLSTQGDSYSNSSGNISFTIGEVVIDTEDDGTNAITQGFHQTNWSFVGVENHVASYEATIFPNPTSDLLNIKANAFENVTYSLTDASGKLVLQNVLYAEQTPIQVSHLAPGNYFLTLNNKTQNLKTFQLIKLH